MTSSDRRLVVLDANEIICKRIHVMRAPDDTEGADLVRNSWIWRRPGVRSAIARLLDDGVSVAIWSSGAPANVETCLEYVLGQNLIDRLEFVWTSTECDWTGEYDAVRRDKPLVVKDLKRVWRAFPDKWSPSNTLIVDNDAYKMRPNPSESYLLVGSWTPEIDEMESLQDLWSMIKTIAERLSPAAQKSSV